MPCLGGPSREQEYAANIGQPAALCAILGALERAGSLHGVLSDVDWVEAGISRKWLEVWWREHKREDRERRKREKAEAAMREKHQRLLASARAKLTKEERALLAADNWQDDDL